MADSNFLQHNPSETNQLDDATYTGYAIRTQGLGQNNIVPSNWLNKALYQCTTMVTALAQMMAAKGYSMNDANVGTLQANLSNLLTNNDTRPAILNMGYSPNMVFDASKADGFRIDLAGNVDSSQIINMSPGQVIRFYIVSGSPGNYSFAWPGNIYFAPEVKTQSIGNLCTAEFMSDGNSAYVLSTLLAYLNNNKQNNLGFNPVQQGGGNGQGTNKIFVGWDGGGLKAQVDNVDLGRLLFASNQATANLNGNGSLSIPLVGGQVFMIQWATGNVDTGAGETYQTVGLPTSFPNVALNAFVSTNWIAGPNDDIMVYERTSFNNNSVSVRRCRRGNDQNYTSSPTVIAFGF